MDYLSWEMLCQEFFLLAAIFFIFVQSISEAESECSEGGDDSILLFLIILSIVLF